MSEIRQKVAEFEARLEVGVHYKNPYPRFTNVVPGATGEKPDAVNPLYLDSYVRKGGSTIAGQKAHRTPVLHDE